MLIKTLLNNVVRFKSFVYDSIIVMMMEGVEASVIDIKPRINSQSICLECGKRGTSHDRQPQRLFEYLPIWSFKCTCAMRRAVSNVPTHGIKIEALAWGQSRGQMTFSYQTYLTGLARRLSCKETAKIFGTSWDTV